MNEAVEQLRHWLEKSSRVLVFTGAGISTASKIPDFRGPQGLFRTAQPVYYQEFLADPDKRRQYWEFKLQTYTMFRDARPSAAHKSVVALERKQRLLAVVTQNVDGLHQAAGTARDKLIELHGTNAETECDDCGAREGAGRCMEDFARTKRPPVCQFCGGLMKPAVVMFGQALRQVDLVRAFEAASRADLVLALGSSLVVTPAADVPLKAARRGTPYIIVNQGATPHDEFSTLRIDADVEAVFPAAVAKLSVRPAS